MRPQLLRLRNVRIDVDVLRKRAQLGGTKVGAGLPLDDDDASPRAAEMLDARRADSERDGAKALVRNRERPLRALRAALSKPMLDSLGILTD